jgi:putative transposase
MINTHWRTRGYLPHRDEPSVVQHVIFNLADAFPNARPDLTQSEERQKWADAELDAGHGALLLRKHDHALAVEDCILRDHGSRYALAAWCIMPNHVHVVIEQFPGHELSSVVQTWIGYRARDQQARESARRVVATRVLRSVHAR